MNMFSRRSLRLSVGLVVFFVALLTYSACIQPTVSFWDCGEFASAIVHQQVPHPPGAPLFLMLGKIAHLIPIGDPVARINMMSAVFSAATIWLVFEIIILSVLGFSGSHADGTNAEGEQDFKSRGYSNSYNLQVSFATISGAAIGALSLCFSDTFWFNAVESEVYAISTLMVALVVYFTMRWNVEADYPGSNRFLVIIAYVLGLSLGVHLLSVLSLFGVAIVIAARRYPKTMRTLLVMSGIAVTAFALLYPGIVRWLPTLLAGNVPLMNEAREYVVRESMAVHLLGVLLVAAPFALCYVWLKKKRTLPALASAVICVILVGFSSYAHIMIRAKASPPMNENEPTSLSRLVGYLSREQYGETPLFPRRVDSSPESVEAFKKYGPYSPPGSKSISSEQYPNVSVNVPDYGRMRMTAGDWKYLFDYQLDHMFVRYLLWNFFGRTGDAQDAEAWTFVRSSKHTETVNFLSGSASLFPVVFWGLPFFLGVFGAWKQIRRDPWQAMAFIALFVVMGIATAFVQNQQEPQPRERDYFYTGAFLVFCVWIGLGARDLLMGLHSRVNNLSASMALALVITVAVPGSMAWQGFPFHTRAGNYLAFDYSYNILQSCERDAILFTNGDNDTFPLWLLQDVYGIRRDVRVVNLSLAGSLWYINALKNTEPWGAKKIPLSFSGEQLGSDDRSPLALQSRVGAEQVHTVPLSQSVRSKFALPDSVQNAIWTARGYNNGNGSYLFTRAQQVVEDCILQTRWERPVYFAVTCGYPGSEIYCGLGDFCRQEGMAYRVCPSKVAEPGETIDERAMEQCLLQPCNPDAPQQQFRYGFILRNLTTPSVYYDEIQRRYVDNYRTLFIRAAQNYIRKGKSALAKRYLDAMRVSISDDMFPMTYALMNSIADFCLQAGDTVSARAYDEKIIAQCKVLMDKPHVQSRVAMFVQDSPPPIIAALACSRSGKYDEALRFMDIASEAVQGPAVELQRVMIRVDKALAEGSRANAAELLRDYLYRTRSATDGASLDARRRAELRLQQMSSQEMNIGRMSVQAKSKQ
jgi:hypothetical protein